MGYNNSTLIASFEAAADLSSKQYYCVELDSSKQVNAVDVSGDPPLGVLQNKPAAQGRAASVAIGGITSAIAGAAVSVGADVMSNGSGQVITATSDQVSIGMALEAATASGDKIAIRLGSNGAAL